MSAWATRCKACGTSFRVSEEQLAISEGYVRCGRCDAVFNARASLFDLDAPSSAPVPLQAPPPAPTPPVPLAAAPTALPEIPPAEPEALPAASGEPHFDPAHPWVEPAPESQPVPPREPVWHAHAEPTPQATSARQEPDAGRMLELLGASSAEPAPTATWSSLRESAPPRPRSRALLALGGAGLAALLLVLPAHWAWIERDALRAQHPALDTWMKQHLPHVPSSGWRHLEGLAVSSSSLRATPQGGAYQLELVVHNRAGYPLAMPWLDLSLSDGKGQALLRKGIDPASLQAQSPLAPNEQRRLQAVFKLQAATSVTGYEIGLFHP